MASFVDSCEGEVTILAGFAILDAVDEHGSVACGIELGGVRVVHSEGNGFAAEPVAGRSC